MTASSEYEQSPEREMWQPPERPLRKLPKSPTAKPPRLQIVLIDDPEMPKPEPPGDASERFAPLRATLAELQARNEHDHDL